MTRPYTRWPPDRVAELHRLWTVEGRSRRQVGGVLGCTGAAVHAQVRRLGWQRAPDARAANLGRVFVRRLRVRCLAGTHCGGWFFSPDARRVRVCSRCRPEWLARGGGA